VIEPIAYAADRTELLRLEESMIERHQTLSPSGYNICPSGTVHAGLKRSPETRARMRASRVGKTPNLGASRTEESKEKIRLALKGRRRPRQSSLLRGRKQTPEHIAAMVAGRWAK
jgi:hypothetical protein